jgi:ATP-dependent helicase/nuclease subunit A
MVSEIRQIVSRGESIGDKETKGRRPASWGDILILVRRRGALFDEILRELKRSGVPVGGADRLKLSEHILFEDLRALVRFALFPGDDLTLAALLRSPFCDVTDESLFDLARDRPDPTLWDTLKRRAGDGRSDWAQAADFLGRVARTGAGHTPYDFIVGILESPGPCGRSQRQRLLTRLGREAEEALGVFLEKTLELEQAGSRHLESYAADLDRLDVDVAREMDAAGADEVRIMTAHGAKGLEAPIVILPDMTFSDPGRSGLVRTHDGTFLWLGSGDEDCKAQAGAREDRSRDSGRELNRLLYVGLTRARDRLILCGILPGNRDEDKLKGWWSAVSEAFADRLGDGVRRIDRDDFSFRRFGPDPEVLGPAGAGAPTVAAAVPPWLGRVARAEPLSRLASPSDLGDSAPVAALSPLSGLGGLGRFRRGELIHRLLQILPDLDPTSWERAARRLLEKEAGLTSDQVSEMTVAALGVLEHPEFTYLFGPGSRAEAGIVGGAAAFPEGLRISGRIDRLVVRDDEVLFADFKTNRPAPARIEDADPAYLRQLAMYWAVLGDLYPGRKIRAALVWTDGPRLTPAPEPLLRSALEALREGFR